MATLTISALISGLHCQSTSYVLNFVCKFCAVIMLYIIDVVVLFIGAKTLVMKSMNIITNAAFEIMFIS